LLFLKITDRKGR